MSSPTKKLLSCVLTSALALPASALAQAAPAAGPADTSGWSAPPLVEAPPAPAADAPLASPTPPAPGAVPSIGAGTPPPPGYEQPPASSYSGAPGLYGPGMPPQPAAGPQPGYPYLGVPLEKPGPEIGLMVTETLFGALTSAGTTLLAYYLLVGPAIDTAANTGYFLANYPTAAEAKQAQDQAKLVANVLFFSTFAAVPLGVAQTESSIAQGSRYYLTENWVATLGALAGQAAVIGVYYLAINNSATATAAEPILLVGTIAGVPLITMGAINLFKTPRFKTGFNGVGGLLHYTPESGLRAGLPMPAPILVQTSQGPSLGVGLSLLGGRF